MDSAERDELVSDVRRLQKLTKALERSKGRIGKNSDTRSWRANLNSEIQICADLVTSIQSVERRLRAQSLDAQSDKLLQQGDPIIAKFETVRSSIESLLSQHILMDDTAYDGDAQNNNNSNNSNESGAQIQLQQQQQQQQQGDMEDMGLIGMAADIDHLQEQNRAVKQIASDVVELKEAFTDLNTLVDEQGGMLDEVEQNVSAAVDEVQAGTAHLVTAERNQVAARKKQCILVLCCFVILGLIFGMLGGFGIFN